MKNEGQPPTVAAPTRSPTLIRRPTSLRTRSLYEGFGNALIEAFYFRKPVLVNRYSIYIADIEPHGFDVIAMNGLITKDVVAKVDRVIEDRKYRQEMVDKNFELSKRFFSYTVLRRKLRSLVTHFTGAEDL